jgi:hypothetical protein
MPSTVSISDETFLEMRWRCLSLAADLDRADRAGVNPNDPRLAQLRRAITILLEENPGRAQRLQMLLSDQSPPPPAATRQANR